MTQNLYLKELSKFYEYINQYKLELNVDEDKQFSYINKSITVLQKSLNDNEFKEYIQLINDDKIRVKLFIKNLLINILSEIKETRMRTIDIETLFKEINK